MKSNILFVIFISCLSFIAEAQSPEILNRYRAVLLPQLYYENGKKDIYGIRETARKQFVSCGLPLLLDERDISMEILKNPCSLIHCLVNNTASSSADYFSVVDVLFINCKNDTILRFSAQAAMQFTFRESRESYIRATQKAMQPLDTFHYAFHDTLVSVPADTVISDSDSIAWNVERKLCWDDFRGSAKDDDPADALTYTCNQTMFEAFSVGKRFTVESRVQCYFIKSKSWVKKEKDKQVDYLLNHEQRHFDLAEVGAREFRKKLKEVMFTSANFRDEVKRITGEVDEKYHRLQQQYDSESDHSRVKEMQEKWNAKIDSLLKELEDY
ncbi:MAG: DUF922 domain-containing protein [Bacteroidetes bacterium]|nr:DUF922 domain-containing protein [Bacteroidota bacterium]